MLIETRRWFRRHSKKFLVGAGSLGIAYLAGQYAWSKWLEARQRMGEERVSKENLRRRFEQNQEDCTYTVLALLPTVREEIIGALPVEDISSELQRQRAEKLARSSGPSEAASSEFPSGPPSTNDDDRASLSSFQSGSYIHASQMAEGVDGRPTRKRTKVQLWNDMKIDSITRSLTMLYTLSLLTLLTRIQLNLLGRRTYLSSVVSLASPPSAAQDSTISLENNDDDGYDNVYGNDFETNRKYLTFSWWLLHRGSKDITANVTAAVKDVFGPINPREDITLERLSHLILEVRKKLEGATEPERRQQKWLSYLLPPRDLEDFVLQESGMETNMSPSAEPSTDPLHAATATAANPSLRRLLDETSDLIDSPTFTHVLTLILNATFSHLIDNRVATEAFKLPPPTSIERVTDVTDRKCKVAQTLAVFCRQAHVIAKGSSDPEELAVAEQGSQVNEYLAAIDAVRDLEAFAAVVYSSNFEFEGVEQDDVPASTARTSREGSAEAEPGAQEVAEEVQEMERKVKDIVREAQETLSEVQETASELQKTETTEAQKTETTEAQKTETTEAQKTETTEVQKAETEPQGFDTAWQKALAREDGKDV